jgi:predicted RNase H-related nuclease YkuK (DUF458 family)
MRNGDKNMFTETEFDDVISYIQNTSSDSKFYIGTDSKKYKKHGVWNARFTTVFAIHIDGKHGVKVFGYSETERDYSKDPKNQQYRLVQEAYKSCELYLRLADYLIDKDVEIHLDLNTNEQFLSHKAVKQSVGYVLGLTNITPKLKPDAWIASYAADHMVRYGDFNYSTRDKGFGIR